LLPRCASGGLFIILTGMSPAGVNYQPVNYSHNRVPGINDREYRSHPSPISQALSLIISTKDNSQILSSNQLARWTSSRSSCGLLDHVAWRRVGSAYSTVDSTYILWYSLITHNFVVCMYVCMYSVHYLIVNDLFNREP
jgi:hypothetical protein